MLRLTAVTAAAFALSGFAAPPPAAPPAPLQQSHAVSAQPPDRCESAAYVYCQRNWQADGYPSFADCYNDVVQVCRF